VLPQYLPNWLRLFGAVDDWLYRLNAPHILDLLLAGVLVGLVVLAMVAAGLI